MPELIPRIALTHSPGTDAQRGAVHPHDPDVATLERFRVAFACFDRGMRCVRVSAGLHDLASGAGQLERLEALLEGAIQQACARHPGSHVHGLRSMPDIALSLDGLTLRCRLHHSRERVETIAVLTPARPETVATDLMDRLTPRERAVARLIARGRSARHIAEDLGISIHTVRRHSERLFQKCGVRSRVVLTALLVRDSA